MAAETNQSEGDGDSGMWGLIGLLGLAVLAWPASGSGMTSAAATTIAVPPAADILAEHRESTVKRSPTLSTIPSGALSSVLGGPAELGRAAHCADRTFVRTARCAIIEL